MAAGLPPVLLAYGLLEASWSAGVCFDICLLSRFGANTAAARASAAAAGERMRETMAGSLAAMKNLNLGFTRRE